MQNNPTWMDTWFNESYQAFKENNISQDFTSINQSLTPYINYNELTNANDLPKVAIIKLNGGLGTSMGCSGPKSLIPCRPSGESFMDIIIQQFKKSEHCTSLTFLNSFNTSKETRDYMSTHHPSMPWNEIMQYPFQKIDQKTKKPFPSKTPQFLNPPGHGSIYYDLYHSGKLFEYLSNGIDYIFISNADNLAAVFDPLIASYLKKSNCPFLIELTKKKASDIKGGTIVSINGTLKLWEIAQVTPEQNKTFEQQPVFNTNNIWVNVHALIQAIESKTLILDLMLNKKSNNTHSFIQLEYAMGSAIQSFKKAEAIIVPRSRFFPVKRTCDLLRLKSDQVSITANGKLRWNTRNNVNIECHAPFDSIDGFNQYFKCIPSLEHVKNLSIKGPVYFNHPISLIGTVKINIPETATPLHLDPSIKSLKNVQFINGKFMPI